jgi:hypothetical protein
MRNASPPPKFEPRQRRIGDTWYVLVTWGDRPSEQAGGFATEAEAVKWIKNVSSIWAQEQAQDHATDRL